MSDKRKRNKEAFRREILEAARELFSADGYGSFSMRKLARRIGYSPTTIYLYFRDKDELLFRLCEDFFGGLYKRLLEIVEEGAEPSATLRKVLLAYVSFGLAHPEHYRVAYFTNPSVYGSPDEFLLRDTVSRAVYLRYRDLIGRCRDDGVLALKDVDTLSQILWSGVHGIVSAALFTRDFPLVEPVVLAEGMVDGLLAGFRPPR
ncbi:MAG TPA: TetR/AcrR family transcriptional regulator [Geobacteraceae bacterium]|nr:TetR/AcrR family transcriptional regulator [Geobacteraceae bacterium]